MGLQRVGALKHMRLVVVFAGTLACLQATLWIVLTVFGIVTYENCSITVPGFDDTFGYMLKLMYFTAESCSDILTTFRQSVGTISPDQIVIWEGIYLGFSCLWLGLSIMLIYFVTWERAQRSVIYLYFWSTFTIALSILDLVFGSLLGNDMYKVSLYAAIQNDDSWYDTLTIAKVASGMLMTIVLRGYLLWIVNVSSAIFLIVCTFEIKKGISNASENLYQPETAARGPITAYDSSIESRSTQWLASSGTMERPHLQPGPSRAQPYHADTNAAFAGSNHSVANSYRQEPRPATEPRSMPWDRNNASSEPYTPRPDYSPPATRAARSALKSPPAHNPYKRDTAPAW